MLPARWNPPWKPRAGPPQRPRQYGQSSNDSFPSAMCIAAAVNVKERLVPAVAALRDAIGKNARAWDGIVKIGRTHMQDATPLTLGQEWSGYEVMLSDDLDRIEDPPQGSLRKRRTCFGRSSGGCA